MGGGIPTRELTAPGSCSFPSNASLSNYRTVEFSGSRSNPLLTLSRLCVDCLGCWFWCGIQTRSPRMVARWYYAERKTSAVTPGSLIAAASSLLVTRPMSRRPQTSTTGTERTPLPARRSGRSSRHYLGFPAIESRSAMISRGSCSDAALRFSRRWPAEDVPGINRMLGER
jgi:hypothetical protein